MNSPARREEAWEIGGGLSWRPSPAPDVRAARERPAIFTRLVESVLSPFAIDLRSLALFRISLTLTLLVDLYIRAQDLAFFYSDDGVLPRAEAIRSMSPWVVSLHFANGTWQFQALLFAIAAAAHVALLLGYATQTASALSWMMLLSLQQRNYQVLQGGDHLLRTLAFWAMFLPMGARWSLDAFRSGSDAPLPRHVRSTASACMLLQIAAVYFFSALLKTGQPWLDRSAVHLALSGYSLTTPIGRSLVAYPSLLSGLTLAVLKLETYGAFLPFVPIWNDFFRMVTVLLFAAFHLGLAVTMRLGPFPYVCLVAWTLFVPSSVWNAIESRLGKAVRRPKGTWSWWGHSALFVRVRDLTVVWFFANVILWNVRGLDFRRFERLYPRSDNFVLESVGLDQYWSMFAPYPIDWDGWYEIVGKTASGRIVNLSPGASFDDPLSEQRPARIDLMYRTERRRKYMMGLAASTADGWRPFFARALRLRWNARSPDDPLASLDVFFWLWLTRPDAPTSPEKVLLCHYRW